jgi:hypothetical protein
MATGIVFVDIDTEARTGAYTILGYLAGSRSLPLPGGGEGSDGDVGAPRESTL